MKRFMMLAALLLPTLAAAQTVTPGPSPVTVSATSAATPFTGIQATETNIVALKIPAGSMGKNGTIDLKCFWIYTNSANIKTLSIRFSNTAAAITGTLIATALAPTTTGSNQVEHIVHNNNATNAQTIYATTGTAPYGTAATSTPLAPTVDTTLDAFLNINGTLALGSETITVQHCTALIMNAP